MDGKANSSVTVSAEDFRKMIEVEVLKIIKSLAEMGQTPKDRIKELAELTLQLIKPGMNLEELYSNALLFVLPSTVEGLSLSLLEAMAFGRCVVSSDIPENREIIGDAGFVFKNGDPGDLERILRGIIGQPELLRGLGQRARELVLKKYDWDEITRATEAVYQSVLQRKGS